MLKDIVKATPTAEHRNSLTVITKEIKQQDDIKENEKNEEIDDNNAPQTPCKAHTHARRASPRRLSTVRTGS
ncbi:hypothetical protein [Prevotella falsenii]|uniref:hypothetical protein n=1 Tax=Prevotella falsenii TaxID=515414 RepID=UPI000468EA3E|nr:hypothetical protein [Prevotella falsenii]